MGFEQLTNRQKEILSLIAQGKSNKEIAHVLVIARRTVNGHISVLYERLGVHKRVQATNVYYQFLNEVGGKVCIPTATAALLWYTGSKTRVNSMLLLSQVGQTVRFDWTTILLSAKLA